MGKSKHSHPGFNAMVPKGGAHPGFNAMAKDPISIQPSHKGELHRELDVPQGQKIPASKLAQARNSADPAERKRATFAENAKGWGRK